MKDMERWAKIQNRQKETVRSPSPVLKTGPDDDKRQSKSADAGFAVFERKVGNPTNEFNWFKSSRTTTISFSCRLNIFAPVLSPADLRWRRSF